MFNILKFKDLITYKNNLFMQNVHLRAGETFAFFVVVNIFILIFKNIHIYL